MINTSSRLILENELAYAVVSEYVNEFNHIIILPKREELEALNQCTPDESKALFDLIEEASKIITIYSGKSPIMGKNFGSFLHVKQLHFHVFSSNQSLGSLITSGRDKQQKRSTAEIREEILKFQKAL